MRIVIITDAWEPQVNGVVRTYQNIKRELVASGHDVKIISPQDFPSCPMPGYKEIDLSFFPYRKLSHMLGRYNPDKIHIAVEGPLGWAARRYCLRHHKHFTTSFHTQFPDYVAERVPRIMGKKLKAIFRNVVIAMVRRFHSASDHIFIATQSLEDQLKQWRFQNPMVRLVRGIDADVFKPGEKTLFQNLPQPIQLYVGRIAVEKNIEAFLSLNTKGTKIVVGHGPLEAMLKRKYPDVIFAGLKEGHELADHYRSADVFVFPSKTDTFGIVLVEAMACGLPIAGYNVTGPKDIITNPVLGAVDDDLNIAVERALASPGTAHQRATHAHTHYSWKKVSEVFASPQIQR